LKPRSPPQPLPRRVPNDAFTSWVGMIAPASTPPATLSTLNALVLKAMRSNDIVQMLCTGGTDVVASSPELEAIVDRASRAGAGCRASDRRWANAQVCRASCF
jgi:hypothetical protein